MKIYLTYRNSDTTEGRGPMVLDKAFFYREHAAEYIDTQPGVMGIQRKWSLAPHGDWQIKEVEVCEESFVSKEQQRQARKKQAMAKLNLEDRKILGLEV